MQTSMKESNNYNINNFKNLKTNESDENVVIGNMSLNTTLKNNSVSNSKNFSINNNNFAGTGKTNTLLNNLNLNEVEEKDEEELYESEFKEDINSVKKIEEEEKYENEFNNDFNELEKIEEEQKKLIETGDNDVNLEDYKEIHESQRIQSQLNFFEDSITDNININRSRAHVVGKINNNNLAQSNNKTHMSNNFSENNEVMGSKNSNLNSINKSRQNITNNNMMISGDLNDSFGDNILQNLNKYRKMALGEASMSQSLVGKK